MKLKPKGRKIYRAKTRFERTRDFFHSTRAVVGMLLLLAVMGFIGFSAGVPIMKFLEERQIVTRRSDETEAPVLSETSENTETVSEPDIQETIPTTFQQMQGYKLHEDALLSEQDLTTALAGIPAGTTHVIVPLKTKGGYLHYATVLEDAKRIGAVVSALPLSVIESKILEAGCIPVAYISTLEDAVYPQSLPQAGYTITGTDEMWLDQSLENGGKPWLSPFSPMALDYLSNVTDEIAEAGFAVVICGDLTFPQFSENDLGMLDPRAGTADRYIALASTIQTIESAADPASVYVQISGADILTGNADVLKTGLQYSGYVVEMTEAEINRIDEITAGLPENAVCIWQTEKTGILPSETQYILCDPEAESISATEETGE